MIKRKFILCLIVLLAGASWAAAQKPVPGKTAAVKDNWKEFVSEEGGFKVKFPVSPTRVVTTIPAGFGQADFVQFRVVTRNYQMVVGFMDFPAPVTDPDELKFRYDGAVTNVLNRTGNRLVSSKDIFINDYLGREAVFESPQVLQTQRAYIVNQRFFALSVIMPVTKTTTAKARSDYENFRTKLFDSFAVTKIPAANFAGLTLPNDFGSSFEGNVYRSSYFGFSMTLPEEFEFFTEKQMDMLREMTINEADLQDPSEGEKVKLSIKRTALLAGAYAGNQNSMIVAAELPSFPNMTLEAITAEIVKEQKKNLEEKIIKPLHPLTIDGVKAYGTITEDKDGLRQYVVMALRKDLVFQIVYSFTDDSQLTTFSEFLKTVKFEK